MSTPTPLDRVLSCGSLPSLPTVGLKVLELTRNPSVRVDDLAKVVETDAALSAKVLRTVNSSLFGLQTPCTTIRRALGYLGLNAVKSIVLGFSLVESAKGVDGEAGFNMDDHWRRAIYAAAGARTIAQVTRSCDPEEAFTAALFQDLGSLAMFVSLKDEYTQAIQPAAADHSRHADLERQALGFTHMEAGAALAGKWRLPDRYVQVIRFHHDPDQADKTALELVRVAALGTIAALSLTNANPSEDISRLISLSQAWFSKDEAQVQAMLGEITKSAHEVAKLFEKSIGQPPDVASIMEQANEQLVASQITAQREAEELRTRNIDLVRQADTDALTGLNNRRKFDDESRRLFTEASSVHRPFALLMLDGDRFKSVNDTHGHHIGDAVLRELARRIGQTVGDRGVPCRYGGEEFAVLVPGATLMEALKIAETVRTAIESPVFTFPSIENAPKELKVTVSIGVCALDPTSGQSCPSAGSIVEAADRALYRAKHEGRNRVCSESLPGAPVATTDPVAPSPQSVASPAPMPTPAAPPPAAPAAAPAKAKPQSTRLLLVEDDALSAKLMIMLLQKAPGLEVEWSADGPGALKKLADAAMSADSRPHVILCDLMLADFDGRMILKFVRSRPTLAKVPFVVLSATIDAKIVAECTAAGATLVLSKAEIAQNLPKWIAKIGGELAALGRAA